MTTANMLGPYGEWAAQILPKSSGHSSFRRRDAPPLNRWKCRARERILELMAMPATGRRPRVRVDARYEHDGLHVEELSWQLPFGPRTRAVFLKPVHVEGTLPGVLALHDHGGRKYFGMRKIVQLRGRRHPLIIEHQRQHYGDRGWANALACRGYAVLVHDGFLFGSRRIRYQHVPDVIARGRRERNPESSREVLEYNEWASEQETVVAKSLICAGTTWPGVFCAEDQRALDVLCARPDVDAARVGCGGLSGGGLRTVFLAGLDDRIAAAFCAGFMTTWRDFQLYKSYTHTWMTYLPGAPRELDFPEILGLRVPLPTQVLSCWEDSLFTPEGMREADRILRRVYAKAGAENRYDCRFYRGGHKLDLPMQTDAFAFLDRWIGPMVDTPPTGYTR